MTKKKLRLLNSKKVIKIEMLIIIVIIFMIFIITVYFIEYTVENGLISFMK